MTQWDNQDNIPDWLKPAYDNPVEKAAGPAARPQTPSPPPSEPIPRPATGPLSRRPGALPPILDIAAYQLEGNPSPDLLVHLGTQKMLADTYYLTLAHEVIQEAEQQVISFVRQSPTHALPTSLDMLYRVQGIAGPLKRQPVQLATVLADTILLATNEFDACPKDIRRKAILGIAQRIVDLQATEVDEVMASERIIKGILQQIELANVQPESGMKAVQLHARLLVLAEIEELGQE